MRNLVLPMRNFVLPIIFILFTSSLAGCFSDPDKDGDSVPDEHDNCIDIVNHDQIDTDQDGVGDACDSDDDGDGVEDTNDAFPTDPTEASDLDGDGTGDNADDDRDGDGVENSEDAFPEDASRAYDTDGDGIADVNDDDDDGDGLLDVEDNFRLMPFSAIDQPGPYTVGTTERQFTGSTGRSLTLQVWYPTAEAGGARVIYDNIFPGIAIEDAEADCSESRPVVMFSHGNTGIRWQSAFLMQWFASHGFVVAAPDHLHNTMLDFDWTKMVEVTLVRPLDISDSFDWLLRANEDWRSGLEGCIDAEGGYGVMGHSFGGYTSLAVSGATVPVSELDENCEAGWQPHCDARDMWLTENPDSETISNADERVWGAVLLAPWNGGILAEGIANVTVPTMILTGVLDASTNLTHVTTIADYLEDDLAHFAQMNETGHAQFAPISCAAGWCTEPIEMELVLNFTNHSALWFFANLLDWPGASEIPLPTADFVTWAEVSDS